MMSNQHKLLRLMIKETLLREMPLAGITEPGETQNSDNRRENDEVIKNKVQRFFKTSKFHDDSVRLLKNLSVPIYLIPVYERNWLNKPGRTFINDTKNSLEQYGISPEKSQEILDAVNNGASAFIIKANNLSKNNLPSLWMTVHAIFDDQDTQEEHDGLVHEMWGDIYDILEEIHYKNDDLYNKIIDSLTMKSARDKNIGDVATEPASEIMCQAILTTNGFTYKESDNEESNNILEHFSSITKNAKQEFENFIRGNILNINVYSNG